MSSPYARNPKVMKTLAERFIESIRKGVRNKKMASALMDEARKYRSIGMANEFMSGQHHESKIGPVYGRYWRLDSFAYPKLLDPASQTYVDIGDMNVNQLVKALTYARNNSPYGIFVADDQPIPEALKSFRHEITHLGQDLHPRGTIRHFRFLQAPEPNEYPYATRIAEILARRGELKRSGERVPNLVDALRLAYEKNKDNPLVRGSFERLVQMNPDLIRILRP